MADPLTDTEILDWLEEHPVVWRTYLHVPTKAQQDVVKNLVAATDAGLRGNPLLEVTLRECVRLAIEGSKIGLVCGNLFDVSARGNDEVAAQRLLNEISMEAFDG